MENRNSVIVRTSIIGILANISLVIMKAVIGLLSNSIAIVMDAVNNLSDAASSVITIVGTKLAGKEPDRDHPFGHGRVEYLSAMIISILVLYAGITAFVESVKKIINPETPDYSVVSVVIVALGVLVKIVLGLYVKTTGEKVNSDSLKNSGADAMMDAVISTATVVAAIIYMFFKVSLEAYLGGIIALIIIKSGVDMLKETISKILGERTDSDMAQQIKKTINEFPEISGAYDLVIHNYGPETYNGSVHIEVPDTLSADYLDRLIRKVTHAVLEKHDVLLTAVGVYSVNTKDEEIIKDREKIREIVMSVDYVMQMHGFYMDREDKEIRFDMVISFEAPNRIEVRNQALELLKKEYPDYDIEIAMDIDFSES